MKKIAILGGGMAALTAAFELTNAPDWKDRHEITVYQLGWRLGGKGASGRGANGRIEEHGLHIWLGFYENAFRLIQRVYQELCRPPGAPLATWEDAFKKHSYIVTEEQVGGRWIPWPFDFPTNNAVPGTGGELPSLWEYIKMLLQWMIGYFARSAFAARDTARPWPERLLRDLEIEVEGATATLGMLLRTAHQRAEALPAEITLQPTQHHDTIARLLDEFSDRLRREAEADIALSDETRRLVIVLSLASAIVRGLLRDGVLFHPDQLDALDDYDFREWLTRHGAPGHATASALLQGLYDLVFAYRNGETDRPSFAAGAALRSIFRMCFTYKGAVFWKMQAGMGDTIFAPLYLLLKQRGVTFKFFHRVKNLALAADGKSVASVHLGRQVTITGGTYDPLVEVTDLLCWPSEPRYDQIVEGDELKGHAINLESFWTPWKDVEEITLEAGKDFDTVVLGISLGGLPCICRELIAVSDQWKAMVANVETVRTMALQLWLQPDLPGLGWPSASPVLDAYVEPLNTWADMSHLIAREAWPAGLTPRSIAYFCGPMVGDIPPVQDPKAPAQADDAAKEIGRKWLWENITRLWPRAAPSAAAAPQDGQGFDWDILVDPLQRPGEARYDGQFWRANIDPWERYVLTVAGSTRYRLKADGSGFENLYLAGDWIDNGFNAGCIEAAVMSGMQASQAICGFPRPEEIIAGSHP